MKRLLMAIALIASPVSAADEPVFEPLHTAALHPVFLSFFDFYKPSEQIWSDVQVVAKNLDTAEEYRQERETDPYWYEAIKGTELGKLYKRANAVIFLPPGRYAMTGVGHFCFLAAEEVEILASTQVVDLKVGCE